MVASVPDGLHYAAELVRAQGTEGGEAHDELLVAAAMRLKALSEAASYLIAERDALLNLRTAAESLVSDYHSARRGGFSPDLTAAFFAAVDAARQVAAFLESRLTEGSTEP